MDFQGTIARIMSDERGNYEVTFTTSNKSAVITLKDMNKGDTFDVNVAKHRAKRTLDANAYYWVLADKLAKRLSFRKCRPVTAQEVYREHIKDVGVYEVLPIKNEAVEKFTKIWEDKGKGWVVVDMGASKINGYHNLQCYYGSSVYNKEEMSRLIDVIIADCKEVGVETKTPREIEELLAYGV